MFNSCQQLLSSWKWHFALALHFSQPLNYKEYTCSVQCITQQLGVKKNFTFFWQEDKCLKIVPAFRQILDIGFSGRLKHNISSVPMHSNTHLCRSIFTAGNTLTVQDYLTQPPCHLIQNLPFKDFYSRYNTDIQTVVIWKQNKWKNKIIIIKVPKRSKWSLWHEVNLAWVHFKTIIFRHPDTPQNNTTVSQLSLNVLQLNTKLFIIISLKNTNNNKKKQAQIEWVTAANQGFSSRSTAECLGVVTPPWAHVLCLHSLLKPSVFYCHDAWAVKLAWWCWVLLLPTHNPATLFAL